MQELDVDAVRDQAQQLADTLGQTRPALYALAMDAISVCEENQRLRAEIEQLRTLADHSR